jgi:hypothetical protein
VARLSPTEFQQLIDELIAVDGLGKLQEKLLRSHAIVSRRRLGNAESLARQLYQLTIGLERDGLASQVVLALWEDLLQRKLDEDAGRQLESIAERINGCLAEGHEIAAEKETDLRAALGEYHAALAGKIGENAARITMLTRAFPAVAKLIREGATLDAPRS